jgi:hypothetical protein
MNIYILQTKQFESYIQKMYLFENNNLYLLNIIFTISTYYFLEGFLPQLIDLFFGQRISFELFVPLALRL